MNFSEIFSAAHGFLISTVKYIETGIESNIAKSSSYSNNRLDLCLAFLKTIATEVK